MNDLTARVNEDNPDPRVACALLLDTSSSMDGEPIAALNAGFRLFCDEIKQDPLAKKRTEVTVITFGGAARVEIPFTEGRDLEPRTFAAHGATPMGAAVTLALQELAAQKQEYKKAGLEYYRPWLFLITDGAPTDHSAFESAALQTRQAEASKHVSVFSVAVGELADLGQLSKLSATRQPLALTGLSFLELFQWLSASMKVVSHSSTLGSADGGGAPDQGEQNPLPPPGWATW